MLSSIAIAVALSVPAQTQIGITFCNVTDANGELRQEYRFNDELREAQYASAYKSGAGSIPSRSDFSNPVHGFFQTGHGSGLTGLQIEYLLSAAAANLGANVYDARQANGSLPTGWSISGPRPFLEFRVTGQPWQPVVTYNDRQAAIDNLQLVMANVKRQDPPSLEEQQFATRLCGLWAAAHFVNQSGTALPPFWGSYCDEYFDTGCCADSERSTGDATEQCFRPTDRRIFSFAHPGSPISPSCDPANRNIMLTGANGTTIGGSPVDASGSDIFDFTVDYRDGPPTYGLGGQTVLRAYGTGFFSEPFMYGGDNTVCAAPEGFTTVDPGFRTVAEDVGGTCRGLMTSFYTNGTFLEPPGCVEIPDSVWGCTQTQWLNNDPDCDFR